MQLMLTFLDNLILIHLHLIYHSQGFELRAIDSNYPYVFDGTAVAPCQRTADEIDNCIVCNRSQWTITVDNIHKMPAKRMSSAQTVG